MSTITDPTPRREEMWGRPECPDVHRWQAPDGVATEADVSALLGALVRALKPDLVVETGAYLGHTTVEIGRALKAEGRGLLVAFEIAPDRAVHVGEKCAHEALPVSVVAASSLAPHFRENMGRPLDLLFVDSEYETRIEEVRHFRQWASLRCVVVAHDTVIESYRRALDGLAAEKVVSPWVYLPTPRGLAIARYRA